MMSCCLSKLVSFLVWSVWVVCRVGIADALASLVFYAPGVPRCGVSDLVVDVFSVSQFCTVSVSVVAWPMCRLALDAAVVCSDR